jgi:hypothetical protein
MAINPRIQDKETLNTKKGSKSESSYSYLVKRFKNKNHQRDLLKENTLCTLETSENALSLHGNFSDGKETIVLDAEEIQSIKLYRGTERVNAIFMSPMWISLKLGIPLERARHFKIANSEYQIADTKMVLQTKQCLVELCTAGTAFEKICATLKNLDYNSMLQLEGGDYRKTNAVNSHA